MENLVSTPNNTSNKTQDLHTASDVRDIVANPDDPIDQNLHRELDLV